MFCIETGFFESDGGDLQKQFQKMADAMSEDHKFGHTFNSEAIEKHGKE